MGEVYLAHDTKLDRKVALKILPADFGDDESRMSRFVREAKSASALNHPNILTIHEIGADSSQHYIATEFIDGKTLRELMQTEPLPILQSLEIACQIGAALNAAHQAGIVHRDIKPENVMVRADGLVKVLDFGLAKLAGGASDPDSETRIQSETQPGMIIGTVAYMSPQQARGKTVDARTDVWSLGVVIYEMLSGRQPFRGETMTDTLTNILHACPEPLNVEPPDLAQIVCRMLGKKLEARYATINDVVVELKYLQRRIEFEKELDRKSPLNKQTEDRTVMKPSTFSGPAIDSASARADEGFWVAVLPFKIRDEDPAVAVLADGLSEEIVTGLSRFRYLSVVTSTSAFRLKGETEDVRSVGAKLGTRYVLHGSIRKGGPVIRVSAQLVDTETGAQLWSETYNRDLQTSTIFAVQDDVAGRIVATVADSYGVLVHSMRTAMRKKDDADLKPVEWQFQYFAYREQITPAAHAALKSRLQRVAERNVEQSDVWACLAQIYVDEYAFGFQGDATSLDRALAAGRRAVELDRANQFALVALAQVHFFRRDLAAFGPAAERGMALNPLNTDALGILGLQIVHTGQFERGTAIVLRAMELNPNHAGWMHFAPLWNHFHKGEYEQALECANRVDVPGLFWPYLVMASACGHLGRRVEAEAAVKDLLALDPEFAAHVRSNVESWHFASGLLESLLEGLRKAGLEIRDKEPASASSAPPVVWSETRADEGFWVAVLPFKYSTTGAELKALAEGLSEDIVMGLSRFSCLRVIARGSTLRYANQTTDLRTVGKELGARYVMEGTLRQGGPKLRLAVQLVDAATGAHLWAENYEREFSSENIFELQDDLVPRIVSTVADWYGVLPHSMSETVRLKSPDQLSPYEALLRSFGYFENIAAEEHALVRGSLERAVVQEPGNADGWAMLSMIFGEEHRFGFNVQPDSLGRSLKAARRAVEIAHANHFAWLALAQALFFRKEFDPFRDAAERAIALNPMDGSTVEYLGHLIAFSGNWERGCELAERARQLNPNHPSWYWSVSFLDAYRKGDYLNARTFLLKGNPQRNWLMHALLAAAQGQLGESEAAARHLREVLTMMPDFPSIGRSEFSKWYLPDLVDHLMDGLRKAGLETTADAQLSKALPSLASSKSRADEGFWVAVLPFKFTGSNTEVASLAEGLSEEIVTGLSRFSYLRVISRSSTLRYASETDDVRAVGKTLGARYVMEGTLRLAGSMLRVSVQLVDSSTGAHLWAETYDRPFNSEDIFALQDDLVPRIVSTVADQYGALVHSMSESLRGKSPGQYSAHEAVLRAFGYWERMTPEEHAEVRDILEAAVAVAPDHSDCLAELAMIYWHEYAFGYNLEPDPLGRARATAQRAVASAPTSHFAHCALATGLFFQKDYLAFRPVAERALALNRMDSSTAAILGNMIAYAGDWEYGLGIVERAIDLNPHHAGWYHYVAFCDAYRKRDYRGALASALKVNMPAYHWPHVYLAAVYGQLGEQQRGQAALRELHALVPNFVAMAREEFGKWLDAELTEHLIEGLRKAGLAIADEDRPSDASPTLHTSVEKRADEGFWVAVLPFKFTGSSSEVRALAEGLSEDVVTGLSRFSYLRVIARSSTERFTSEASDVRLVGQELGARYVMEGSLRQAGKKLRLAVQLVDAITGAHLWAENYERTFDPESLFELQDDLVPRIVATVADIHGVLPRSMSELVRSRAPEQLSPYEAVLRSFNYFQVVTPEELEAARSCLEIAVAKAPAYVDAWAMLAVLCAQDYGQGFNLTPDSLADGLSAARRAVEAGPSNHLAYFSLMQALFFQKEFQSFRDAAERAITLNPMDGNSLAFVGELLTYVGDSERGLALSGRAKQLNPHHPGWYWYADFFNAYQQRDYRGALSFARKANLPNHWGMHAGIAASAGQLGESEVAAKAVRDLLKLRPEFAARVRKESEKWWEPELIEHFLEGLRKAGLEISGDDDRVRLIAEEEKKSAF